MPNFEGEYSGDSYITDGPLAVTTGAVVVPTPAAVSPPRSGTGGNTRATVRGPMSCLFTVEAFPIRVTLDGVTTPTATVGLLYPIGGPYTIWGGNDVKNLRMIGVGGTSNVNLSYRGAPQ